MSLLLNLMARNLQNKLGFLFKNIKNYFIIPGTSVRVTPQGVMKIQGIFISRLVEGGLAESTGLLAVNDEVLEVNGIEVCFLILQRISFFQK